MHSLQTKVIDDIGYRGDDMIGTYEFIEKVSYAEYPDENGNLRTYAFPDTAESIELVRCKDCKHWDADDHECNIKTGWFSCGADWFCADGERKDT